MGRKVTGALLCRQFRQEPPGGMVSCRYCTCSFFGTADFIANELLLYCRIDGETYFPVFKQYAGTGACPPGKPNSFRRAGGNTIMKSGMGADPYSAPLLTGKTTITGRRVISRIFNRGVSGTGWAPINCRDVGAGDDRR